jgi:hypothetical protein
MAATVRIDSLKVGERFRFPDRTGESAVWVSDGTVPEEPTKTAAHRVVDGAHTTQYGQIEVVPLDQPRPVLTDEPGKVTKLTGPNSVSSPGHAPDTHRITLEFEDAETLRQALDYIGDGDAPVFIAGGAVETAGSTFPLWDGFHAAMEHTKEKTQ